MIKAVEGKVSAKEPNFVILKTNSGVSYGIFISLFTNSKLNLGEIVELKTTHIVREDANLLYGFLDLSEQKIFEILLKISGIGATTAMAVCSTLSVDEFTKAVANGDIEAIKKVPGIGPKTARTLIAQLSDAKLNLEKNSQSDAILALESLGFKRDKICSVLTTCTSTDTSELVKEALKKLAK